MSKHNSQEQNSQKSKIIKSDFLEIIFQSLDKKKPRHFKSSDSFLSAKRIRKNIFSISYSEEFNNQLVIEPDIILKRIGENKFIFISMTNYDDKKPIILGNLAKEEEIEIVLSCIKKREFIFKKSCTISFKQDIISDILCAFSAVFGGIFNYFSSICKIRSKDELERIKIFKSKEIEVIFSSLKKNGNITLVSEGENFNKSGEIECKKLTDSSFSLARKCNYNSDDYEISFYRMEPGVFMLLKYENFLKKESIYSKTATKNQIFHIRMIFSNLIDRIKDQYPGDKFILNFEIDIPNSEIIDIS